MSPRLATLLVVLPVCPFLLAAAAPPTTQPQKPPTSVRLVNDLGAKVAPEAALGRKLPDIKFSQVTLEDAIDFLRDVSGTNLHVNWRALEGVGITRQSPVTMQLNDV